MTRRSTLILGAIALALVAYIVFYERNLLTTAELEARQGRLIEEFVRDRVDRVEIQRGQERITLVRAPVREGEEHAEEEQGAEPPTWSLQTPIQGLADADEVASLLGALEWASARRTLEDVSDEDVRTFGLDAPRVKATFRVADRNVEVAFGNEDVHGGGVYVRVGGARTVFVAGKDLFEAVDQDADHFRSKDLVGAPDANDATRVAIAGTTIERRDRTWWAGPFLGSSARIEAMLTAVEDLRAARFTDGALGPIERDLAVTVGETAIRLRTGAVCEGHPEERFAQVDDGPIVCVLASALDDIPTAADTLRESRLVTVRDEDMHAIVIASHGTTLRIEKRGEALIGTVRTGTTERTFAADPQAVLEFMRAARGTRATTVDAAAPSPPEIATLRIELERDDDAPDGGATERAEVLTAVACDGVCVVRAIDQAMLVLPNEPIDLFVPSPLRFLSREIIRADVTTLNRIAIERGAARESVGIDDERWMVSAPIAAPADGPSMRELTRDVSALTAVRFVADQAAPEHGLSPPRAKASFTFAGEGDTPERTYVLEIGADVDDGTYARVDGGEVFVANASIARVLTAPLASRELLASDTDDVTRIAIDGGASLEREGGELVAAHGTTLSAERVRAIADALASLRAAEVRPYGTTVTGPPRRTVHVTRSAEAAEPHEYSFEIYAEEGEGHARRVLAKRTDLDVVLAFEPAVIAAFVD